MTSSGCRIHLRATLPDVGEVAHGSTCSGRRAPVADCVGDDDSDVGGARVSDVDVYDTEVSPSFPMRTDDGRQWNYWSRGDPSRVHTRWWTAQKLCHASEIVQASNTETHRLPKRASRSFASMIIPARDKCPNPRSPNRPPLRVAFKQ